MTPLVDSQALTKTLREQHEQIVDELRDLLRRARPFIADHVYSDERGDGNEAADLWERIAFVLHAPKNAFPFPYPDSAKQEREKPNGR